jgi:hypothetical protein
MQHFIAPVLSALTALALLIVPGGADPTERPPKPYPVVAITLPAETADPSLWAFRETLAAVARSRLYAELARLVEPQAFFWERDFAHEFDPRRAAVDNLAAAIRLEHADGTGWQALAAYAAEPAVEPLVSRPGVVCAPAPPIYDGIAFARMLDETYGADFDWTYPRSDGTPIRSAPEAGAPLLDTLGLHFVRRLGIAQADGAAASNRNRWARIVTPAGLLGFVAPGSLGSLKSERLCYSKDAIGRWRIAGVIAGVN